MRKILMLACALSLTACASEYNLEDAQYWQRKNTTSALYLQGPKAQQTLHMDIASCVNEISELQRVGELRRAIPADTVNGKVLDPATPSGRMAQWETPKRDGYLLAQHGNYHDFETCMDFKGWERVEYLPYSAADRARDDYVNTMAGKKRPGASDRENVTSVHADQQPAQRSRQYNQ